MNEWKLKYKKGCLIEATKKDEVEVIVHGCNCFCNMGKGIAKAIRLNFPQAFKADCTTQKGDKKKMGTITFATIPNTNTTVVNAYTQYTFWDTKRMLSYPAVRSCMQNIKQHFSGKKIGLPKIGAGLACGDWKKIEEIIKDELNGEDVTIYVI